MPSAAILNGTLRFKDRSYEYILKFTLVRFSMVLSDLADKMIHLSYCIQLSYLSSILGGFTPYHTCTKI